MRRILPTLVLLTLSTRAHTAPWGPGTWEFNPGSDPFGAGSLINHRGLNEAAAGEKGFVRLSPDGNSFVLGDGRSVRFWAVGTDIYRKSPSEMDEHARFLAALGVNMIRIHADIAPKDSNAPMTSVDDKEVSGILRMVAAAKKQGIYSTISPFWPHHKIPASWGIEGYSEKECWGLFFFNDKLQAAYKSWVKELYTRKNPDTGMTLAQDPAVAIIQVMNEDSLLFWTSQAIEEAQKKILRTKFASWLAKKYGGAGQAPAAWQGAALDGDDWPGGKPQVMMIWDLTQPQAGGRGARSADQMQFYSELQRNFYADVEAYLKSLGAKQLFNAMNWRPADPVLMYDAERWGYQANEVQAVNKYVTGLHVGENNGWRIDRGHHMTDDSALLRPESLPTNLKQVSGSPFLITESTWVQPLGFQSEGPFLMGAYQALTGVDAFYWFSATDATWNLDPRMSWWTINGENPTFKWSCSIPPLMGQFPAAALAFRMGYLKKAEPVVHEERLLQDLWQRKVPIISEEGAFDPNRDQGAFAEASAIKQEVDRLAFLVGPVEVVYGGDPAKNKSANFSGLIDRAGKKVRSATGEIELDYGIGLCKVNAPAFQGFSGFIKKAGGTLVTTDLSLRSGNEYLTAYFVSMDGQPLASSSKILVQAGTISRLSGWETQPATFTADKTTVQGEEITHIGNPPWRIQETDLAFGLRNGKLSKARVLDVDGRPKKDLPLQRQGEFVSLQTPRDWTYLILE